MEEAKIPVFTVLKKGATLKNIFLNSPPPDAGKPLSASRDSDPIFIGRHPDCHIIVDHPSISRFHLEIHPKSFLQKLFVTDLSSVHGTWISGKKIQPNVPVELFEGDTVKLGASTRIYCLHWIPLIHAFELAKPMPPLLEEASDFINSDEVFQDEDLNEVWVSNAISSVPPIPEIMKASSPRKLFSQDLESIDPTLTVKEALDQGSCFSSIAPLLESVSSSLASEDENGDFKNLLNNEMLPEREEHRPLRSEKVSKSSSLLIRRNKSVNFLQIEKISKENECEIRNDKDNLDIGEQIFDSGEKSPLVLFPEGNVQEEGECFVSDKENISSASSISSKALKKGRKIEKSPLRSFNLFNKEALGIVERNVGALEGKGEKKISSVFDAEDFVKEEEETFVSGEKSMIIINSIVSEDLKCHHKIGGSPPRSVGIFIKEVSEIEEHNVGAFVKGSRGEELSSVFLVEDGQKDEDEICALDQVNVTPVNSFDSKVLKSNHEAKRFLPISFSVFNKDDVKVEEQKIGAFSGEKGAENITSIFLPEEHVKEEEDSFVSDINNTALANSFGSKVLKCDQGIETSPLNSEPSNLLIEKSTSQATKHIKSSKARSRNHLVKEKENLKMSDAKNMDSLFSPGIKLQRSLFKPELSPLGEKKILNVEEDRLLSDKENWTPKSLRSRDLLKSGKEEDEIFASDKENLTPQSSLRNKLKSALPHSHGKTEGETLRRRKERIPFQPLLVSSPLQNISPASYVGCLEETCSRNYANNVQDLDEKEPDIKHKEELLHIPGREKTKWYIVVDVGCFLTEESRKSLQLLEGIKGTQLIIPSIVIRELDHLKRCQGILSRGTKAVSILQWIEDCMVKTSWWIHVQSSSEVFPVAPTPPATPRSQLCDGNFTGFSTCGSLMEIVSPTAEDHILDCALLFKKIKNDGQLMLLTSSTTLKIKAMAEGLLCETPKEFRESLVNPFSERFFWANSSPRGFTWSCLEESGLSYICHQQFIAAKMAKAEGTVKGLKLIVPHSSRYDVVANSIS